jgi:hypothetical protein
MGKTRKTDRQKGNLKASSSANAADLAFPRQELQGFNAFSDIVSFANDVPPAVNVALKKIAKRDSMTKNKALEELESLLFVPDSSITNDVLELILPYWVCQYAKLCVEPNNRTRFLASSLNSKMVKKLRKRIAPLLKQLIIPWLASSLDNDMNIAKIALDAFEVILRCRTVCDLTRSGYFPG